LATQNRHLTPKKTTLDEAIATDIAINIIAIQYLKFFLKKLSKNVATCLTLTVLRDIKISTSVLSTTIDYSDDIKAIFIKYNFPNCIAHTSSYSTLFFFGRPLLFFGAF